MPYPYEIIRSNRKTMAMEISKELKVIVRAPNKMPQNVIHSFVAQHQDWIAKTMEKQKSRLALTPPAPTPEECEVFRKQAKQYLPERVSYYSEKMGLSPIRITITGAKTRFGSCSPKNAISFSYFLMQYPPQAIDYVVVHELAHIRHHNHSKAFWALIEKYMPDYIERRKLLK